MAGEALGCYSQRFVDSNLPGMVPSSGNLLDQQGRREFAVGYH